jgi:epsilon-lactone hydrolase
MVQETKIPMFGVNFRKCVTKETAFPAALQDAIAALYYLLDEGYRAENISISGDSGGGCIAITTLLCLKRYGLEVPECAILISSFVDLVDDYMGDEELLNLDFLNPEMLDMTEYQYTENRPDLRATLLSPALNDLPEGCTFKGFPRTFVAYGDAEVFAPSIIELIRILRAAGVKVQTDIGKDQPHNYPYYNHDRSENGFYGKLRLSWMDMVDMRIRKFACYISDINKMQKMYEVVLRG